MKMKQKWMIVLCILMVLLATVACGYEENAYEEETAIELMACEEQLEVQLGLLNNYVSDEEWEEALHLVKEIDALREERFLNGEYEKSREEKELLEELNQLYDDCTEYYLSDESDYANYDEGEETPKEETLAAYKVTDDGSVHRAGNGKLSKKCPWNDKKIKQVWQEIMDILPQGSEEYFVKLRIFTDGADETLAYVEQADDYGAEWIIAVDPADYEDEDMFVETIVHEFFHCVTLNDKQALYTDEPDVDAYTEAYDEDAYCVYYEDSYIDDFYRQFWTGYIDDREINMDSECFYLRHEDDFVTDYAATMPSEDICESFAYFVLYDSEEGDAVWQQKIDFFYDYPELVEYRDEIRSNLGI